MKKITTFHDSIDPNNVASVLKGGGIAILNTTRPNAKEIASKVEMLVDETLLHLSVGIGDGEWYQYLFRMVDGEPSIDDAENLVRKTVSLWAAANYPNNFSVSLFVIKFTERAEIALNKLSGQKREKTQFLLDQLQRGEAIHATKHHTLHGNEEIWLARVDQQLRLLYSKSGYELNVLDIVDASEYAS